MELDCESRTRNHRYILTILDLAVLLVAFAMGLWWAMLEPLPK
jgi:hypothetical protein